MLELSIEETNRIRAALGLRLIPLDGTPKKRAVSVAPQVKTHGELPGEVVKPQTNKTVPDVKPEPKTASTASWLQSLKIQKPEPESHLENPKSIVESRTEEEPKLAPVEHKPEGETKVEESNSVSIKTVKSASVPANLPEYDPVHTREEFQPVKLQKNDFKDAKPQFKRRKKNLSKIRKTEIMEAPEVQIGNIVDEDLTDLLARERIARQIKESVPDSVTNKTLAAATETTPNIASDTTSFLARLKKLKPPSTTVPDKIETETVLPPSSESDALDQQPEPALPEQPKEVEAPQLTSMASTLALLRQAGAVEDRHHLRERNAHAVKARKWSRKVAAAQLLRQHELEIESARLQRLPASERELKIQSQAEIALRDEARRSNLLLKDYSPDIDLGHQANNEREVYKEISRAFHGTTEGKKRRERRDRTAQRERRLLEKSLFPKEN